MDIAADKDLPLRRTRAFSGDCWATCLRAQTGEAGFGTHRSNPSDGNPLPARGDRRCAGGQA
jgi:hypothetical protein